MSVGERVRRRKALLRRRIVAGAVAVFMAAWGTIFVQLASGHDPALAGRATATATAEGKASGESSSGSSSQSDSSYSAGSAQSSPSPVTTSQS